MKYIVPETVKRDPLFKQSAALIRLQSSVRKRNQIDIRKVRAFQIWQSQLLNFYLVQMEDKMKFLRRGVLCCRLRFLSKLVRNRLRRYFCKWALKVKSTFPLG